MEIHQILMIVNNKGSLKFSDKLLETDHSLFDQHLLKHRSNKVDINKPQQLINKFDDTIIRKNPK